MDQRLAILDGPYLRDLLAQPEAVEATLDACRRLPEIPPAARDASHIILTGMGSSFAACHPLNIELIHAGRRSTIVETSELVHAQFNLIHHDSLVVAVSQSGRSAETVQLLERIETLDRKPCVIGVTNTADSPLATRSDFCVALAAGPEFSVSCKTYLATLIGLEWLASALTGSGPDRFVESLRTAGNETRTYLERWPAHVATLSELLRDVRHLFIVGRGRSLAASQTGGLIIKESARFHAEAMSSPAFRHGPLEMVDDRLAALVMEGLDETASLNRLLAEDIVRYGGRAELIGPQAAADVFRLPSTSTALLPLLEMLPLQMVSLALALNSSRQPGVFARASKVTTVA